MLPLRFLFVKTTLFPAENICFWQASPFSVLVFFRLQFLLVKWILLLETSSPPQRRYLSGATSTVAIRLPFGVKPIPFDPFLFGRLILPELELLIVARVSLDSGCRVTFSSFQSPITSTYGLLGINPLRS